jgi:NADPH-dependent 2,4-dienoyl-CoA reductase/sulfur reductase-like enzyme
MTIERVVIAGAGLAGLRTAEALRRRGYDGSIVLVGAEPGLPYDRPPLSKEVLTGTRAAQSTTLRSAEELAGLAVEMRAGERVEQVDPHARTVRVGRETLPFDRLVVATGARPRPFPLGAGLAGVHVLRTLDDAVEVRRLLASAPRVVVVGAGFIGAEVASSARALGLDVTIVEAAPTPLVRAVGPSVGEVCAQLHREHGTRLVLGAAVTAVEGTGQVERVRLADGSTIACDLLVVGIGVLPDAGWLAGSGLTVQDGLVCDEHLNAGHPAIYAAGDVARWPNALFGRSMRAEQWTNAAEQARYVARVLLDGPSAVPPFTGSNYFWSDQYGMRIQFAGVPDADEIHVADSAADGARYLAYYRKGATIVGVFGIDAPREVMRAKLLIEKRTSWAEALTAARAA